jgi:hypothetical protein
MCDTLHPDAARRRNQETKPALTSGFVPSRASDPPQRPHSTSSPLSPYFMKVALFA